MVVLVILGFVVAVDSGYRAVREHKLAKAKK